MPRTRISTFTALLLSLAAVSGCDQPDDDRAEVRDHSIVGLAAWESEGRDYTLLTIDGTPRIVATATDLGIVVVAADDGTPLAAAAGSRFADVDVLLTEGRLALRDTPSPEVDSASAALLELAVSGDLELDAFRAGLVADTDPVELPGACFVDWVITVIDVAVNTPYLMAPSYAEWCG